VAAAVALDLAARAVVTKRALRARRAGPVAAHWVRVAGARPVARDAVVTLPIVVARGAQAAWARQAALRAVDAGLALVADAAMQVAAGPKALDRVVVAEAHRRVSIVTLALLARRATDAKRPRGCGHRARGGRKG
jgi:hypothetical protein